MWRANWKVVANSGVKRPCGGRERGVPRPIRGADRLQILEVADQVVEDGLAVFGPDAEEGPGGDVAPVVAGAENWWVAA